MMQKLDSQIGDLYRLPLEEFTKARNALAKQLSGSERKQTASLVKPSLPMWVINQLFWQDAPTYKALIDAAEKLRAAHRSVLNGRKVDVRSADQLHRATIEKAFAKAIGLAEKGGLHLTDQVRESVRRTLAALPGEEPDGRLTRVPEPAGFSLLSGVKIRPQPASSKLPSQQGGSSAENAKSKAREEREAGKRAEGERKEAERKARQEQKAREKREREIKKAEQALRDAERRLAQLKG
jgi:hypothetical protein